MSFLSNMRMRTKLVLVMVALTVIPLVVISVISYNNMATSLNKAVEKEHKLFLSIKADNLAEWFSERQGDARVIASSGDVYQGLLTLNNAEEGVNDPAWLQHKPQLQQFSKEIMDQYGYGMVAVLDENGKIVFSSDDGNSEGADLSSRGYIQKSVKNNTTAVSSIFWSDVLNENCIAISAPVYSQGRTGDRIGMLVLTMSQQPIDAMVHDGVGEMGDSGDSYLVDSEGLLLTNTRLGDYKSGAALNESIETYATQDLGPAIEAGNTDFVHHGQYADYRGTPIIGTYTVTMLGDQPVGLIAEIDEAEAMAAVNSSRNTMIVMVVVALAIVGVLVFMFTRMMSAPLAQIVDAAESSAEETKKVTRATNEMAAYAQQVQGALSQSAVAAEQVSAGSTESAAAMEEVAGSVADISAAIDELAAAAEQISGSSQETFAQLHEAERDISEGREVVSEAAESMRELESEIQNVGSILDSIMEITEQTNLLALNAAIEAARAGEHGRGFAVVADEVRKLAEESAESTQRIRRIVEGITNAAGRVVTIIAGGEDDERSRKSVIDAFNRIADVSEEVTKAMEAVVSAAQQQAASSQQAGASSQNVSANTQQVSAQLQEANSAAVQMADNIDEVVQAMEDLTDNVEEVADRTEEQEELAEEVQEAAAVL